MSVDAEDMTSPLIGITMASLAALDGPWDDQPSSSVIGSRYIQAVAAAGGLPWPIAAVEDALLLRTLYDRMHGLLIPGGADIRPVHYGASPHPTLDRGDSTRDEVESLLLAWAWRDGKPVLGICRGMQMLNVARGGTLVQDLATCTATSVKHDLMPLTQYPRDRPAHKVSTVAGTRLRAILGAQTLPVNSIHHQAVDRLGAGLVVAARGQDGVVEAVEAWEHPFFCGVQWHPEELPTHPFTAPLLNAFADACRAHADAADTPAPVLAAAG